VTPTTHPTQIALRVETEAPVSVLTNTIEPAPEAPVPEPASGGQEAPTRATLATHPQTSDDTSEEGAQDVEMPTVSAAPVEPATQPAAIVADLDPQDNDTDMATKADAQRAKIAEKKATRDTLAKSASAAVDRLFTPTATTMGKKSKAKERPPTKAVTRASGVPVDDKGVPLVTAAANPLG
ncbi:hypothetical protein BGZ72_002193, partial [Mortierella alpina]